MNKADLARIQKALKLAELDMANGRKMGKMMDERELYDSDPIPVFREGKVKSVRVSNTAVSFEQLHPKRWGSFDHRVYKDKPK